MRFILLAFILYSANVLAEQDHPAIPSSDALFNNKTCEQILFEKDRLTKLYQEEKSFLPKSEPFSLRSFFDSSVDKNYRRKIKRYRKIKGQYESAVRVAEKKCS